jgi:ribosomal protein S13
MPLIRKAKKRTTPAAAKRSADAIRDDNERKFASAFSAVLKQLVTPGMVKKIRSGLNSGKSPKAIVDSLPYFEVNDQKTWDQWMKFAKQTTAAYIEVVNDAIEQENRKRGWSLETLAKAKKKKARGRGPSDPTFKWVNKRSLSRVVDMSDKEKERVRGILTDGVRDGIHPSEMVLEIQATVGVTKKQAERIRRKVNRAIEDGMSRTRAKSLRSAEAVRTRGIRAKAIARTETNDALNFSLAESWREADEEGIVPPAAKKKWVAMMDSGKDGKPRTSEVCRYLNDQEVGLNENFSAPEFGFEGPGPSAHPN